MPYQDQHMVHFIEQEMIRENAEREAAHEPSGLLSASMLYQPLRFQVLKTLGVPRKPFEAFTLGKFDVGNTAEEKFAGRLEQAGVLVERQRKLTYREAVGYCDAVVDSDKMEFKHGVIPHEIKSVTNMKLKRIKSTGIDYHYKMQAAFYALAMGTSHFAIDIVSCESSAYVLTEIFQTADMKNDIDKAISEYMTAMENRKKDKSLPKFEANPKVPWTAKIDYAMFAEEWAVNNDSWAVKQLGALGLGS